MKTKIEIKSMLGDILFEYEKENNSIKDTLIEAVKSGANLCGANLFGANLRGANLRGANLCDANLYGANLCGANLCGAELCGADLYVANLCGAELCGADLRGAYLRGANLYGANLYGANLRGAYLRDAELGEWGKINNPTDILIVGKIGSRNDYTAIFRTDKGVFVSCGCFRGTLYKFESEVKKTHKGNKHERDYLALIQFVKIKFEI